MGELEERTWGFIWSGIEVSRVCSFERAGIWHVIKVKTDKSDVEVYVTPSGKMRVYRRGKATDVTRG